MRYISLILLSLCSISAYAQNWLPLDTGNQWTYRARGGTDGFTIRVGAPVSIAGQTYHPLSGYVSETLPVRFASVDSLVYYDSARGQEILLTDFEPLVGIGLFVAPFRECDPETVAQALPDRNPFQGPIGNFDRSLKMRYQTITCADAGLLDETYVSNIGLVQRTVNTIIGPRMFDLVFARIGKMTLQSDPGVSFGITTAQPPNRTSLTAHLDLAVSGDLPVTLHYLSTQDFDAVIRTPDGRVVWQWSDGQAFGQIIRDETTSCQSWNVDVPMTDRAGNPLAAGVYTLEAWLVTGYQRPQFVASTSVQVASSSPLVLMQ